MILHCIMTSEMDGVIHISSTKAGWKRIKSSVFKMSLRRSCRRWEKRFPHVIVTAMWSITSACIRLPPARYSELWLARGRFNLYTQEKIIFAQSSLRCTSKSRYSTQNTEVSLCCLLFLFCLSSNASCKENSDRKTPFSTVSLSRHNDQCPFNNSYTDIQDRKIF